MSSVQGNNGERRKRTATKGVDPSLLKAEISFWKEMIMLRDSTTTDEALERMQQALLLAQRKLANSPPGEEKFPTDPDHPCGNVYLISGRKS